jgi:Kef-type K+ transport system membrane component KefB
MLTTLGMIMSCLVLYGPAMLDTAGSLALLSMTIFMVGMGLITYRFGFGLKESQRSVMSLGMLTRNFAAVLVAVMTVPDLDPLVITMIVMWVLWSIVLAAIAARIFGKQAAKTVAANTV